MGDFKSRQTPADFVDWVQEFVVFAVPKGFLSSCSMSGNASWLFQGADGSPPIPLKGRNAMINGMIETNEPRMMMLHKFVPAAPYRCTPRRGNRMRVSRHPLADRLASA